MLAPVAAFGGLIALVMLGRTSWLTPPEYSPASLGKSGIKATAPSAAVVIREGEEMVGFLDMQDGKPVLVAGAEHSLEVSGWAACTAPGCRVERVVVLIDGRPFGEVVSFFARPDVARAYGRREFERSGWRTTIWLRGLRPGRYWLSARGIGSNGKSGVLPAFQLIVVE